jgi:hypothetical protein
MFGDVREALHRAAGVKIVQVFNWNARDQFDPADNRAGLQTEGRFRPEIVPRLLPPRSNLIFLNLARSVNPERSAVIRRASAILTPLGATED